jgi:hypothetical protein
MIHQRVAADKRSKNKYTNSKQLVVIAGFIKQLKNEN